MVSDPTAPGREAAMASGVQDSSAYMALISCGWFHTAILRPTAV
jgi:hypothetical protein